MTEPHAAYHVATLLRDGRVLVAGGVINDRLDGWVVSASAELYDPSSASWTATGGMISGRWGHTATLLSDGTVLIAGGVGPLMAPDGLASVELYDPSSGTWTTTGRMGSARQGHTATLLADGRVLVVGGGGETRLDEGPDLSVTSELYDPRLGRWTATGSMTMARFGHTATLLPDGTVLVVGGGPGDDATARSAELYDPGNGKWTVISSMANARSGHSATLLPNGAVLVTGGVGLGSDPVPLASAELYDPSNGRWTVTGSMTMARPYHTATLLPDGRVLVVGDYDYDSRASAELYDPGGGT